MLSLKKCLTDIANKISEIIASLNRKTEIIKSWENDSPTSSFNTQTINISGISEGDIIGIECYTQYNSTAREIHWFKAEVGAEVLMTNIVSTSDGSEPYLTRRQVLLVSLTSLQFGTGYYRYFSATNTVNNNYAIPSAVYVMKR